MSRSPQIILGDIVESIALIERYTEGVDEELTCPLISGTIDSEVLAPVNFMA